MPRGATRRPASARARRLCSAGSRGRPRRERTARIAEGLRLQEVAVPADGLDGIDSDAEALTQALHEMRVAAPATGHEPSPAAPSGHGGATPTTDSTVNAASVAAPSCIR